MDTLGKKLKAARQKRKLTASEAAKGTRIKVQHIEAIENDDFSSIAAPTYAKGFIRIYAEFLGLNPEPLIEEYVSTHAPKPRASLIPEEPPTTDQSRRERASIPWSKIPKINWRAWQVPAGIKQLWSRLRGIRFQVAPEKIRKGFIGLAVLLIIGIGVMAIQRHRSAEPEQPPVVHDLTRVDDDPAPAEEERPAVPPRLELPIIEALPEPYLE